MTIFMWLIALNKYVQKLQLLETLYYLSDTNPRLMLQYTLRFYRQIICFLQYYIILIHYKTPIEILSKLSYRNIILKFSSSKELWPDVRRPALY